MQLIRLFMSAFARFVFLLQPIKFSVENSLRSPVAVELDEARLANLHPVDSGSTAKIR